MPVLLVARVAAQWATVGVQKSANGFSCEGTQTCRRFGSADRTQGEHHRLPGPARLAIRRGLAPIHHSNGLGTSRLELGPARDRTDGLVSYNGTSHGLSTLGTSFPVGLELSAESPRPAAA